MFTLLCYTGLCAESPIFFFFFFFLDNGQLEVGGVTMYTKG